MLLPPQETVRFNEMFTGILGHDLRNPLGAIMTAARLAMARDENDKLRKPLSRILASGDRMRSTWGGSTLAPGRSGCGRLRPQPLC